VPSLSLPHAAPKSGVDITQGRSNHDRPIRTKEVPHLADQKKDSRNSSDREQQQSGRDQSQQEQQQGRRPSGREGEQQQQQDERKKERA
jgi:hypothetical protein